MTPTIPTDSPAPARGPRSRFSGLPQANRIVTNLGQPIARSEHEGTKTYRFDAADLDRLHATLSSYLGHFRRANAHTLWRSLWRQHGWLAIYFTCDAAGRKVVPRYAMPKGLGCVRHQYAWARGAYPGDESVALETAKALYRSHQC